jgi:anti-anti-sigma regulatory factor
MAFEISIFEKLGRVPVTVLHLYGDLDAFSYQDLIAAVREAYGAGSRNVVLDLADVPYVNSSGLAAIQIVSMLLNGEEPPDPEYGWATFHTMHHNRGNAFQSHLKLLSPQPHVEHILEMVGFKRYLETFVDLEAAVASF